jgi:hypothetical protein
MEVSKFWVIETLETKPQEGDLQDVVCVVHYRRKATDGIYIAEMYGAMGCETTDASNFTPYANLTKEQIESWLNSSLDVEAIDEELNTKLENIKNPPVVVLPLPFTDNN